MLIVYVSIVILVVFLLCTRTEGYEPTTWYREFKDYYSGSSDNCDNGCCNPVICSLKGKCQWKYNGNTYGGNPAMCKDFRNCLQYEKESDCVKKLFGLN